MVFHVLTLFPEMIAEGVSNSIMARARAAGLVDVKAVNIRDYTLEKHGRVDDYTYGGGAGLLMAAQPVYDAHCAVKAALPENTRTVYLTPQGRTFTQEIAAELAKEQDLILLCGHYEGIDERALEEIVTDEISIGDYVLTGGELPALVLIDAVSRLIPGVLHNENSAETDSFQDGLLEYPQYTRPEVWRGKAVPPILLSGDHARVDEWRLLKSLERTAKRRPDLYAQYEALHRKELEKMEKRRKKREARGQDYP